MPSSHKIYALILAFCLTSIAFALYLQHAMHLEPCPLCIFQRLAMISVGLLALLATLHRPQIWGSRIYGFLITLASLAGMGVAIRHVWLQHLPADQVPSCGPGLNYMLDVFPMQKVISLVLRGSGECAKIDWTLAGFTLPEITLVAFAGLTLLGCYQMFRR